MTMRMGTSWLVLSSAVCVVIAGCSGPESDGEMGQATMTARSEAAQADAGVLEGEVFVARRIACSRPAAPLNGSVRAPQTRVGAMATYACATGYALIGNATRRCQANATWSGRPPTCSFVDAGTPCGACGGTYDANGVCSVATPANLGSPCDLGTGQGACAGAGCIACDGSCEASDPAIGDATAWHITPAANGSWDWDCDGAVTTAWVPTAAPADCASYADSDGCQGAAAVDYVTEATPCGQQAVVFTRDCQWMMTFGPACIDTADQHRVVYQQCR